MEPRPGCLALLLGLLVAMGAVFVAMPSGTSVEESDPVVVEVPAPSPT
jgi:hypothetical protein